MAVFLVMSTVVPSQFEVWDTPLWETKFGKRFVNLELGSHSPRPKGGWSNWGHLFTKVSSTTKGILT